MINPQKGIDLMNNTSIINRILFAVTIFHYSILKVMAISENDCAAIYPSVLQI
jgi:hypothetical protein